VNNKKKQMEIGYLMVKKEIDKICDQKVQIPKADGDKRETLTLVPGETKFEKFQFMQGMGYDEEKIRAYLSITAEAFRMMEVKQDKLVSNYLRFQAKTGHMQNLKMALNIQWQNTLKLKKRADTISEQADKHPEDRKLAYAESHLRQTLNNAVDSVYQMQQDVPLAHAFDKFIKENIIEPKERKGSEKRMAILPDQLRN
jgi:hypothetical protein